MLAAAHPHASSPNQGLDVSWSIQSAGNTALRLDYVVLSRDRNQVDMVTRVDNLAGCAPYSTPRPPPPNGAHCYGTWSIDST